MSDDLVERLRKPWFTNGCERYQLEAADRIEELERENKRLDAGWHEANAFALKQGLRAEALELALTQSRAETAAAYERAAECIECAPKRMRLVDIEAIRALATPEQSAALDAVKAEARAQGMHEASEIAAEFIHRRLYEGDMPACSYHSRDVKTAILAAIQKGELE